jgi:Ca2+-binding EF-hand superfamily protein
LSELDPPVDRQQADRVFDKMDSDRNDKVDKKEFLGAFAAGFLIPGGGPTTTTTTRRTTSTTTFATVTTTTTTARKADMSLVEFRTKMRQWSGVPTNKAGCEKLDLMGDGTISLDEFVPAAQIIAEVSEADAQLLFNEMDANGDGSVSMNECIISGPWMKRQISSMGDAAIVLKTYDFDGSGDLSETEFATLCSLTDPPVSAKRQPALFAELDTNENGKLEVDELREDTTTTTTTTVLPNHAGQEIGAEELSKYIGIPAVVTGSSRFSFVADKNIPVPPMDTLPDLVSPVFLKIFGPSMGIEANFQSQAASFIDADDTSLVPGTSQAVKVQVSWEAKVEDGGQFQIDLTNKGAKIHDDILAELKASQVHFISQSKRCFWTQATSAYYGMALVRVTRGTNLEQQFGYGCVDDLTDQSGSPPFDLP